MFVVTTLSVWGFDAADGAEAALRRLERQQHQRLLTLDDVAVVAWPAGTRRPRAYQVGTAEGTAALSGAFWGLLFGLLFLLPLAGVAVRTAGLAPIGLSDAFLQRVRDRITPGTSGLFLLAEDAALEPVREALPVDLLLSHFDHDQEAALRQAFAASDDDLVAR